ncbi:4-hydroxythreonine-4-phosphate dehydrogenase PdxA [Aquisediminimonas sediminicola]|uniref:4-hydroxythreonine-4-phosphate dehydrogenase PdxA n=1 Tax=Alteraquisediminimonas sediminicola TaxID=2676787 RepID=UPI001C8D31D9|nr:4-hydroxythreonine-4-phosphate dehydrogenase PdxA [Aquisediminimonas sediminicola]
MTVLPLAIALGDPAGIGPEIVARAWANRKAAQLPLFFAVGDARSIAAVWDGPVCPIASPDETASVFEHGLPLIQVADAATPIPGQPDLEGARCALDSLELATGLVRSGAASALVTGPVCKAQLYAIGFTHPGQTEFVAERFGISSDNAVMMLAGPDLKVVPVTTHIPLKDVAQHLDIELICAKVRVTARALQRDFGIPDPRIAIAGLNPHAGENGEIGREEIDIILPAIQILRDEGLTVIGPLAADTMFHARARAQYDVAICHYHDQALIPLKLLHFDEGVNITLGLPAIRTSPDHGTAFDIAGKHIARADAMIAAIRMAAACAERRQAAQ